MDKDNNKEHIHIGNLICRKLEENGQKKNWLAEKISSLVNVKPYAGYVCRFTSDNFDELKRIAEALDLQHLIKKG